MFHLQAAVVPLPGVRRPFAFVVVDADELGEQPVAGEQAGGGVTGATERGGCAHALPEEVGRCGAGPGERTVAVAGPGRSARVPARDACCRRASGGGRAGPAARQLRILRRCGARGAPGALRRGAPSHDTASCRYTQVGAAAARRRSRRRLAARATHVRASEAMVVSLGRGCVRRLNGTRGPIGACAADEGGPQRQDERERNVQRVRAQARSPGERVTHVVFVLHGPWVLSAHRMFTAVAWACYPPSTAEP